MNRNYLQSLPSIEPEDLLALARSLRAHAQERDSVAVIRGFTILLADRIEQMAYEWVESHLGALGAFEASITIAREVAYTGDRATALEIARRIEAAAAAWRQRMGNEVSMP